MNLPNTTFFWVRTAPFQHTHVLGPDPKEFERVLREMKDDWMMGGKSGLFVSTPKPRAQAKPKLRSATGIQQSSKVFEGVGPVLDERDQDVEVRDDTDSLGGSSSNQPVGDLQNSRHLQFWRYAVTCINNEFAFELAGMTIHLHLKFRIDLFS